MSIKVGDKVSGKNVQVFPGTELINIDSGIVEDISDNGRWLLINESWMFAEDCNNTNTIKKFFFCTFIDCNGMQSTSTVEATDILSAIKQIRPQCAIQDILKVEVA